MTGLILKDMLNLKRTMKQMLLILVIFAFVGFTMKSPSYIGFMLVILSTTLVLSTMSYDEYAKWESYALSMPVNRRDMVTSKYAFLLIAMGSAFVVAIIAVCAMCIITNLDIRENILTLLACLSVMLFIYSLVLPASFKYGVEKGRLWMVLAFGVPFVIFYVIFKYAADHPNVAAMLPSEAQAEILITFSPLAVLVILLISWRVSIRIYEKKEF